MTETIKYQERIIKVHFTYEPAEKMVWTYANGPGHPGSDECFEIFKVEYNGRNIIAWLKDHDFEQIENIIRDDN